MDSWAIEGALLAGCYAIGVGLAAVAAIGPVRGRRRDRRSEQTTEGTTKRSASQLPSPEIEIKLVPETKAQENPNPTATLTAAKKNRRKHRVPPSLVHDREASKLHQGLSGSLSHQDSPIHAAARRVSVDEEGGSSLLEESMSTSGGPSISNRSLADSVSLAPLEDLRVFGSTLSPRWKAAAGSQRRRESQSTRSTMGSPRSALLLPPSLLSPSVGTPLPASAVEEAQVILPNCPDDFSCQLINDVEHMVSYRHHCRLRLCPLRSNAFHSQHFIHCERGIDDPTGAEENLTVSSMPKRLSENYFFTSQVLTDCACDTSGTCDAVRTPLTIRLFKRIVTDDSEVIEGHETDLTVTADWSKVTVEELAEYLQWTTGVDRRRLRVVDGTATESDHPERRKVSSFFPQPTEQLCEVAVPLPHLVVEYI